MASKQRGSALAKVVRVLTLHRFYVVLVGPTGRAKGGSFGTQDLVLSARTFIGSVESAGLLGEAVTLLAIPQQTTFRAPTAGLLRPIAGRLIGYTGFHRPSVHALYTVFITKKRL